jgi:hypothetical protein
VPHDPVRSGRGDNLGSSGCCRILAEAKPLARSTQIHAKKATAINRPLIAPSQTGASDQPKRRASSAMKANHPAIIRKTSPIAIRSAGFWLRSVGEARRSASSPG